MQKLTILLVVIFITISCKQEVKLEKPIEVVSETPKEEVVTPEPVLQEYPEDIKAVLKAHGGIETFNKQNTMIFEVVKKKPLSAEKHVIDLKNRFARIETDKFTLGFDGKDAWLKQDSTYFKGDPRFYHNLMFYFYAMPFVLGDAGIIYEKVDDLKVGDSSYPGYRISYADGVGDSSKDTYFLYFDATSYQMKYLGYTVTYFTKKANNIVNLIEYSDWNVIEGLTLPKTLTWRKYNDGIVGEVKSEMHFINAVVKKDHPSPSLFKRSNLDKAGTM